MGRRRRTVERGTAAGHREVNAGLEDGGSASITIDTDPRRSRVGAGGARRLARRGDGKGTGHRPVGVLYSTKLNVSDLSPHDDIVAGIVEGAAQELRKTDAGYLPHQRPGRHQTSCC